MDAKRTPGGRLRLGRARELVLVGPGGDLVCERCLVADDVLSRARGLLGRRFLGRGEGVLIVPCSSIHTALMRFPIDVVFLDADLEVVSIRERVRPWRAAWQRGASAVLELAAGECARLGMTPGSRLGWGSAGR